MAHVVVVGGGIAGIAAAWFLRRQGGPGLAVTVLEGSGRLGGKLDLTEVAGVPVDTGAEALLNRRPEAVALARAAGLGDRLRHPATTSASLWSRGALRPIPGGTVMGVPADLSALEASGVLSAEGMARVRRDLDRPVTDGSGTPEDGDVAIGRLVAERLGPEVVERLVEPLLGGVYAGHADRLSLDATVPQLAAFVRDERSLVRAAERARAAAPSSDQPVFAGLDGGVAQLVPAVARAAGADVRTDAMVRELHRTPTRWRLVVGPTRAPANVDADAVVIACPAAPASRLLAGVVPAAAADLGTVEYASVATIVLAFPATAFSDPLVGSGFLVPPAEGRTVKAATFSSVKWGWLAERLPGTVVVRCSVGRHGEVADLQRDDADLAAAVVTELHDATGVAGAPFATHVRRWGGALPQYAVGHRSLVERVRSAVATQRGLALTGAAYDGVGVAACVATAESAATQVLAALRDAGTMTG